MYRIRHIDEAKKNESRKYEKLPAKLQDPYDPSRSQLNQVTWATAYSGSQLNLVDELITWVTAYQERDQPDSFDEENIPRWARKTSLTGTPLKQCCTTCMDFHLLRLSS